jgi:hypothetical protein
MNEKKTVSERFEECATIRSQLLQYMDAPTIHRECKEFVDDMAHFVRSGVTSTKTIFVPALGRSLHYCLSNNKDSFAVIKKKM